jgi:hypothetical protein
MEENTKKIQDAILNYLDIIYPDCAVTREIDNHVIAIKNLLGIDLAHDIVWSKVDGSLEGLRKKNKIKQLYTVSNSEIKHKPVSKGIQWAWGLIEKEYTSPN